MRSETEKNLDALDRKGWILGPREGEEAYFARIEALQRFFSYPPETVDHFLTDRDWEGANLRVEALYGCAPDWIVAHYSNQQLSFFQGGATWIAGSGEVRIPLIQLKEKLERGRLLKLYSRDEILSHEAVHAVRMQFDEPKFEEIFAYQTSTSRLRRWFGPIFEKPWEAYVFLGLLLVPIACEVFDIFGRPLPFNLYLRGLPAFFFTYLMSRLFFYRLVLHRAFQSMTEQFVDMNHKWAVALRLTDREIFRFAFSRKEKLRTFIREENTPRWKLLRRKFFKPHWR